MPKALLYLSSFDTFPPGLAQHFCCYCCQVIKPSRQAVSSHFFRSFQGTVNPIAAHTVTRYTRACPFLFVAGPGSEQLLAGCSLASVQSACPQSGRLVASLCGCRQPAGHKRLLGRHGVVWVKRSSSTPPQELLPPGAARLCSCVLSAPGRLPGCCWGPSRDFGWASEQLVEKYLG